MENLISSGLYGKGLVEVNRPLLIERYNACLKDIGLQTTSLSSFSIDGMGWSPQVAEELDNPFYLSHMGMANPHAIIITPEQAGLPVQFPFHSFDRDMMRIVFKTFENHIRDITAKSAIWIDIDQEISAFLSPEDLLLIDSIELSFNTPDRLIDSASEQRKLVRQFNGDDFGWAEEGLLDAILESRKKHGDLRYSNLEVPNTPYTHVQSFHTRGFDGVFVLRTALNKQPALIFEDTEQQLTDATPQSHVEFHIDDTELEDFLFDNKLLIADTETYPHLYYHIQRIEDKVLMDSLVAIGVEEEIDLYDRASRKRGISLLIRAGKLSEFFVELERITAAIKKGIYRLTDQKYKRHRMLFAVPNPELNTLEKELMGLLLAKMAPYDVYWQYYFDKEGFYSAFKTWSPLKQKWAIDCIKNHMARIEF